MGSDMDMHLVACEWILCLIGSNMLYSIGGISFSWFPLRVFVILSIGCELIFLLT